MRIYLRQFEKSRKSEDLFRECLRHYVKEFFQQIGEDAILTASIQRLGKGKPYLPSFPGIHFSISHSGSFWGCAFHTLPVGFDLEVSADRLRKKCSGQEEERWLPIARRFFTPEEYLFIRENGRDAFFRIWVRKEACVKHSGGGISSGLDGFSVIRDGVFLTQIEGKDCMEIDLSPAHLPDGVFAACFGEKITSYSLDLIDPVTNSPLDGIEERQDDRK